jgi:excisionase family DNA binding protein
MQLFDSEHARINDNNQELLARHRDLTETGDITDQRPAEALPSPSNASTAFAPQDELRLTARPTLTVQETADLLGISRWLVQQAVRRGELPVLRIGRRILIPRVRLQALLAGAVTNAV